ncbi:hypothetical protein BJ982_002892 [Sphaerisporangium siamense]|uniref:Uncharacterized protein n=1 Tax=Sphaerisporangium siamense TaxID=795645 RepID=A0A7W7G846_9ACTN|nr:hypothetical protein [Sphaerisporangium siamense]
MPRHGGTAEAHTRAVDRGWEAALAGEYRLAALNRDYPAWRIARVRRSDGTHGGWWAFRHAPLTPAERTAGLYPSIARRNAVDLVMELTAQNDIAAELAAHLHPAESERNRQCSRCGSSPSAMSRR